jgi:tetratricopeptide (TPR) repeat protein
LRALFARLGVFAGVTLLPAALYAMFHTGISRRGGIVVPFVPIYLGALFLIVSSLGWILLRDEGLPERSLERRLGPLYVLLAVAVIAVAWSTNVNVVRADVYFKLASQLFAQARYEEAIRNGRRALDLQPEQDVYHLGLGKVLVQNAEQSEDPDSLFHEATSALLTARELAPLKSDHPASLARLFNVWGMRSQDPSTRTERLSRALTFSEQATALSPNTAHLWNDKGNIYATLGDSSEALRIYEHSLSIDDRFHETYLLIGNLHFARREWADAARAYEEVIRLKPDLPLTHATLEFARAQMQR